MARTTLLGGCHRAELVLSSAASAARRASSQWSGYLGSRGRAYAWRNAAMPTVGHVRCAGGATMCGFSHGGLVAILLAMFAVISAGCASGAAATPNGPATLTPGGGQTQATSTVPATGDCSTFAPGHRIPWPIFPCPPTPCLALPMERLAPAFTSNVRPELPPPLSLPI